MHPEQDGEVIEQLGHFLAKMENVQGEIHRNDQHLTNLDPERRCLPDYVAGKLTGSPVSNTKGLAKAVSHMRQWPLDRRLVSSKLAEEAIGDDKFFEDFFEMGERFLGAVLAAPARLGHQVNLIALSMEPKNHWSTGRPSARLLWGASPDDGRGLGSPPSEEAFPIPSPAPRVERAPNESDQTPDPTAAFGMVALVSNRTSSEYIGDLMQRLEGSQLLILEDTCGSALDALGYNCHSGGEGQRTCLAPVHAAGMNRAAEKVWGNFTARIAWRRHAATRTVARSALALGESFWGSQCSVWFADFRTAEGCPGPPLNKQIDAIVEARGRLHIVKDPEGLLDMKGEGRASASGNHSESDANDMVSSRWSSDTPLAVRLAEYIDFHRRAVAVLSRSDKDKAKESSKSPARQGAAFTEEEKEEDLQVEDINVLVYSCQPFAQCGGHGDRLNGIITVFLLAVLTKRVFLIDSESPLPMELLLEPRAIDWRVRGSTLATAGLRHHSYHDKRKQFEADLERLATYPDRLLVVSMNYRMIRSLFEAPSLREQAQQLGLPVDAPPFFVAEVFHVLFAPALALREELHSLRTELAPLEDGRFVAVHLRTGEVAWDPVRHGGPDELQVFLDCARIAEKDLGLGEVPWLLATDSAKLAEVARQLPEAKSGKLRVPAARGRVHIDRSELTDTLEGASANYAEWLLFGRAGAAVLSRSYFGETAAEVGRVRFAYFAPGGGCVRTELSSS
eukprot:TRINITY_DN29463_c0_g1_i1.p1 TRINITY_DN29463_c0_g1~~TRINITY_DN29463_c0_g1_i1.p1  ORF type:complete len:777 (-),score=121.33 TRINITY_DN29463_c0_g1_i1:43-2244(-)